MTGVSINGAKLKKNKAKDKKSKDKRALTSKLIIVLVTVIATVVVQELFGTYIKRFHEPNVVAGIAIGDEGVTKVTRKRAIYVITYLEDVLTHGVWYVVAFLFPPDINVALGPEKKSFQVKLMIENDGGNVAKGIRCIVFEPDEMESNVIIPKIIDASVRDLEPTQFQPSKGKEIVIKELGAKESVVVSIYLTTKNVLETDRPIRVGGYVIFEGKLIQLSPRSMRTCMDLERMIGGQCGPVFAGSKEVPIDISDNPKYGEKVPTTAINLRGVQRKYEVFRICEKNRFRWE